MTVYLVTSSDARYWQAARPYYESLARELNDTIYPLIFAVGCAPPPWLCGELELPAQSISHAANAGASALASISHGSFLPFLPTRNPADVIIFTDSDMMLQRPLHVDEMRLFQRLPAGAVCGAWNAGPGDTLADEARRLRPTRGREAIERDFPGFGPIPCYNGGLLIARRPAWERLRREYMARWQQAAETFNHPSWIQWLINYAIHAAGLERITLTPDWHCHFHYGVPSGVSRRGGLAYYEGRPVLWTHKGERFTGGDDDGDLRE